MLTGTKLRGTKQDEGKFEENNRGFECG
jgi:hypothetical protein